MPELPEVETVRAGLARWITGRTIADVEVRHPRSVRRHLPGGADFAARLRGARIAAVCRRGKYLWLPLDTAMSSGEECVVGHLGMSGQLLVRPADAPDEKHLHVRITFTDRHTRGSQAPRGVMRGSQAPRGVMRGSQAPRGVMRGSQAPRGEPIELRFVDQRTFGGLMLDALIPAADRPDERIPAQVAHIARDPLDPHFDDALWARRLRQRQSALKRALLDQTLSSGIGNIYADESLWRARLHGERVAATLTRARAGDLLAQVRAVLGDAVRAGGTSFDALYVNVNGESGYFDRSLSVYGRAGLPCPRCGTPVRRVAFMNRSSFFCPRCQPPPRRRA